MSKYTPGPWKISDYRERGYQPIENANGDPIALVVERRHDARLIATAPEMLEALKTVRLAFLDGASYVERVSALMDVEKVIDKAEGKR